MSGAGTTDDRRSGAVGAIPRAARKGRRDSRRCSTRQRQPRGRPRRRRHHERDPGRAARCRRAAVERHRVRVRPGRRGRELGRVEQRGDRARRPVRAELHAGRPRRPGRPVQGPDDQRAVPGLAAVLVAPRPLGPYRGVAQVVHHPRPARRFVTGEDGRAYMRTRYEALARQPLFDGLEYAEHQADLAEWIPLMMEGRDPSQVVAATRSFAGTDVNFGALTRLLLEDAERRGVQVHCNQQVHDLERERDGRWRVTVRDTRTGEQRVLHTRFVFVGAGGGALPLLQRAAIPEIRGFGGFPVNGKFLRTRSPELVSRHQAKVYGQAAVGAPPMSVPHLDLRLIDGDHSLLFGPYAGFSPKFLKAGSMFDLPRSVRPDNLGSMLGVARTELTLTRYLLNELMQSRSARHQTLSSFVPGAEEHDWDMITAGQRVQVIKRDPATGRGVLQFGTELVVGADGSIAGLLGASPGASTAVSAMLSLLERCFPERIPAWRSALQEAIPSYGRSLSEDPALLTQVRAQTMQTLELNG